MLPKKRYQRYKFIRSGHPIMVALGDGQRIPWYQDESVKQTKRSIIRRLFGR